MIWLALITICLLVTKVVLATVVPSARRKGDPDAVASNASLLPHEGKWISVNDIHGYRQTPVRVRVARSEDLLSH